MRFQFYSLAEGELGAPVVTPVGDEFERTVNNTMGSLQADAIADAEARFAHLVRNRHSGDGQIVLMSPMLGEPPGSIIAVEVVDPLLRQARLQWAWHDGTLQL